MKKKLCAVALIFTFIFGTVGQSITADAATPIVTSSKELHGVWVSFMDYDSLGLANVTKAKFKKNAAAFLQTAKKNKVNAVFLQVRSFDDAIWMSKTFPASSYLSKKASASKTAAKTYTYDPLEVFLTAAKAKKIEVHAWLNPYRINQSHYLDPGLASSRSRVKKAVAELLEYDIAGIHFDDYFYHAPVGYVNTANRGNVYPIVLSSAEKCKQVNTLVKSVYKQVHQEDDMVFGISPQGNVSNDINAGADIYTWLSKKGYVDYLVPQIYWTDNYGSAGTTKMYTDRLNEFAALRKNSAKLYIGLALYRTGSSTAGDPGWRLKSNNLASQVRLLRQKKANGYILFSARYLYNAESAAERSNLLKLVK